MSGRGWARLLVVALSVVVTIGLAAAVTAFAFFYAAIVKHSETLANLGLLTATLAALCGIAAPGVFFAAADALEAAHKDEAAL